MSRERHFEEQNEGDYKDAQWIDAEASSSHKYHEEPSSSEFGHLSLQGQHKDKAGVYEEREHTEDAHSLQIENA